MNNKQITKDNLLELINNAGVLKYGDFILKSGESSNFYLDMRKLSASFKSLSETSTILSIFIKDNISLSIENSILGIPQGATLIGNKVSEILSKENLISHKAFQFRVGGIKKHGNSENRIWVTGNIPKKVILIEDVITTGGSTIEFINKLTELEIETVAIVSLMNRCNRNNEKIFLDILKDKNIEYFSILKIKDIKK